MAVTWDENTDYKKLMDEAVGRNGRFDYIFEYSRRAAHVLAVKAEMGLRLVKAYKAGDKAETVYEIADLAYHLMVLMVEMGITTEDVHRELASRHIIDHKVKQEKMTK